MAVRAKREPPGGKLPATNGRGLPITLESPVGNFQRRPGSLTSARGRGALSAQRRSVTLRLATDMATATASIPMGVVRGDRFS